MFNHTQRTITGQSPAAGMRNDRQPYIPAFQSWQLTPSHSLGVRHRRGGAVIIVVLALLSLMIFLGVFFFEFTQEEQLAAQNYAVTNQFLDPEPYFEEAEKQLIIGPDASRSMSPLSAGEVGQDNFSTTAPAGIVDGTPGTPHSLIAHIIGRMQRTTTGVKPTDLLPHNRETMHSLIWMVMEYLMRLYRVRTPMAMVYSIPARILFIPTGTFNLHSGSTSAVRHSLTR
jgi:hypothetical protein